MLINVGAVRISRLAGFVLLLGGTSLMPMGASASSPLRAPSPASHLWRQLGTRCRQAETDALLPYPWPLRPFHEQHPVRGYFGDPRTVIDGRHGNVFAFHNGIDIAGWPGNRVYPVISGRVLKVVGDDITVVSGHDLRFKYVHVRPLVRVDQHVTASRTVLGEIFEPWDHVHLSELHGYCVLNPLAPGHLTPYVDRTRPTVDSISFFGPDGNSIPASSLSGEVQMVAQAHDEPAMPAAGIWRRMPVSPALVAWRLRTLSGRVVWHGVAADFRRTEPPDSAFCTVYAPGTIQNFAADRSRYLWGRPGRYRYRLAPGLVDTGALRNGSYRLTVSASDTAGNTGTRTIEIGVRNLRQPEVVPARQDPRCQLRANAQSSPASSWLRHSPTLSENER
jgi:hypothetical protein